MEPSAIYLPPPGLWLWPPWRENISSVTNVRNVSNVQSLLHQQEKSVFRFLVFFKSSFELPTSCSLTREERPPASGGAQLHAKVGDLPQKGPLICSIQISFVGSNEIIVNQFKEKCIFFFFLLSSRFLPRARCPWDTAPRSRQSWLIEKVNRVKLKTKAIKG